MKWAPQQEDALRAVNRWLKTDQQVFRLFGYAGTGKTTLAKHLADGVDGKVLFAAYTGKAAQVLTSKGCPAKTIHQLIYVPKMKSKQRLAELQDLLQDAMQELGDLQEELKNLRPNIVRLRADIAEEEENVKRMMFQKNFDSEVKEASLVVIDECSMVDKYVGEDLLSFGCKVLVLGDPAQLPPVGGGGFFTDHEPDMMLTDIHRQAKDSPIIHMATLIREGKALDEGRYGDCAVHPHGTPMRDIAEAADQIICGRNKTRRAANQRVRSFLGLHDPLPMVSDRLVCLRNNHKIGLLNGQIWIAAEDAVPCGDTYELKAYNEDRENDIHELVVWSQEPNWYERTEAEEFDFGYCLTCHKAQGSQWDHVMVMDESRAFRKDAKRWLYTAITRAAERLDVVRMA